MTESAENDARHDGLRILRCWQKPPWKHESHTFSVKGERYWCPGYPVTSPTATQATR